MGALHSLNTIYELYVGVQDTYLVADVDLDFPSKNRLTGAVSRVVTDPA